MGLELGVELGGGVEECGLVWGSADGFGLVKVGDLEYADGGVVLEGLEGAEEEGVAVAEV